MRRKARRGLAFALAVVVLVPLVSCASQASGRSADPVASVPAASASPTPTCAVPEQPGVEPPEGCIVYDGEANMPLNELYRERMDISDEALAAGQAYVAPFTAALTSLRDSGQPLTEAGARAVFAEAGLGSEAVQAYESDGDVLFGISVGGGCVFGSVTPEAVAVDVGGYIMDGGCLPAIGH